MILEMMELCSIGVMGKRIAKPHHQKMFTLVVSETVEFAQKQVIYVMRLVQKSLKRGLVMTRREEILKYIKENRPNDLGFLSPLVDDMVDLEERLTELRQKPTIEIHPSDSNKQRVSPFMKTYKELLQQYNNCLKIIILKANNDDSDEESPLRAYMKQRLDTR